jgi:hypothetical protein
MHGQFDDTLHFTPAGSNLLIVCGPLIADSDEDLAKRVRVEAELTQDGPDGREVERCNTSGRGFSPAPDPGATWTMNLHTNKIVAGVPVSARATLFVDGDPVFEWQEPQVDIA